MEKLPLDVVADLFHDKISISKASSISFDEDYGEVNYFSSYMADRVASKEVLLLSNKSMDKIRHGKPTNGSKLDI